MAREKRGPFALTMGTSLKTTKPRCCGSAQLKSPRSIRMPVSEASFSRLWTSFPSPLRTPTRGVPPFWKLGNSGKEKNIALLAIRLEREKDLSVIKSIHEAIALLRLGSADSALQISAIKDLTDLKSIGSLDNLKRLAAGSQSSASVALAARGAIGAIKQHIGTVNFFGTIFRGISLGSILLVVALGLAITFGLMGIINMAHGEMIAVGAYTCYVIQNLFGTGFGFSITLPFHFAAKPISFGLHLPGMNASGWFYESYFLFALPLSFLMAALAGLLIERTVIRFLYRRPAGITAGHLGHLADYAAMFSNGFRRE